MNQNRLVINQIAGANIVEYELDLFDNVPLPINKSIIDIQNIAERKSDFSKTITLPGTSNNNDIFSNIFNLARATENTNTYNFAPDFNPTLKADAILYKNGIVMIQGYLQLTNINVVDDNQIEYEINIIGKFANLFQDLGEKKLNELDLSAYDHTWNFANIQTSWTPSVTRGYYYGLIDQGLSNNQKGFFTSDMKPQIFARTIVDAIFKDAGYRYASLFFTTGNFNKLVVPTTQEKLLLTTQEVTDRTFEANRITNSSLIALPKNDYTLLPFNNTSLQSTPIGYDNTTFIFTVPTSGVYSFACNIDLSIFYSIYSFEQNCDYSFSIKKNAGLLFNTAQLTKFIPVGGATIQTSFQSQDEFFDAGDEIQVQFYFRSIITSNSFNLRLNTTSNFFSIANANLTIDSTMQLEKCLPSDIKQADFLASIIKMFNLYVSVDELDSKKLKIETRDVYFTSDTVDLTNKIDVSRGVEIKPLGALKYKDYTFAMQEDKDELNEEYQRRYAYPYGTKRYIVQNDFITESYKTEVVFAPTPLQAFTTNAKIVTSRICFKNSNNASIRGTSKLRLLVAGGLSPFIGTNYFHFEDPDGTLHSFDSYAYVGHYDNILAPTFDINFDVPKEINYKNGYQTVQSPSTLYNLYHKKGIEEITNKDSKLVEFYIKLNEVEINNLSFRNLYFIDKQYYRLYEVDFDSNSEDPAKLTFLKLAVAPAFVPYNLVTNGGGGGEGSAYAQIANRNGTQYPKGVDVIAQGNNNTIQGYEQIVNSDGNFINGSKISVLGGQDNTLLNSGGTYLNCDGYVSVMDNEVVINNIHQPYYASRILTISELQNLHTTPIQILAAQTGYWIEIFRAYITVFFGTTTPKTGYTRRKLDLKFAGDGTVICEFDNSVTTATTATMQRGMNVSDTVFKDAAIEISAPATLGAAGNSQMLIELEYRLHPIIS